MQEISLGITEEGVKQDRRGCSSEAEHLFTFFTYKVPRSNLSISNLKDKMVGDAKDP